MQRIELELHRTTQIRFAKNKTRTTQNHTDQMHKNRPYRTRQNKYYRTTSDVIHNRSSKNHIKQTLENHTELYITEPHTENRMISQNQTEQTQRTLFVIT